MIEMSIETILVTVSVVANICLGWVLYRKYEIIALIDEYQRAMMDGRISEEEREEIIDDIVRIVKKS
jgi:hypothetical protein